MNQSQLIVIGLDGVSLDLATSLACKGVMPNLGFLLKTGIAWSTISPLPEVSPVCWTTMFSGVNPGEHGIFGFGEYLPGSYQVRLVDANMIKVFRLWDHLSRLGRRSVVVNVPLTYPASPISSVMISGFVTPELTHAVYPPWWLSYLQSIGYRPEANLDKASVDPNAFIIDQIRTLEIRLSLFKRLLDEPWDFFVAVFTDTDRVNHFFWSALNNDIDPLAIQVRSIYTRIDSFFGFLLNRFSSEFKTGVIKLMIVADHSFGPIRSEVYLNPWLIEMGYLKVKGSFRDRHILPETKALALDPGRIYLHRSERFLNGRILNKFQIRSLLEEIRSSLIGLRYKRIIKEKYGIRVVEDKPIAEVHMGYELYHGSQAHMAPDIVATPSLGYSLRSGLGRGDAIFGHSHLTGAHQPIGALALIWPPLFENKRPKTIQELYGFMVRILGLDKIF